MLRWLGIAGLVIGYPILAHYTNSSAHSSNLGAFLAITPLTLISLALAWRSPRRMLMLSVLVLVAVALWTQWPALEHHYGLVYWLQHVGMQLILLIIFGRTLIAGRQPLCTRFAEAVHAPAPLTLQHEMYARQVTIAWTFFFAAMALISSMLFFLTPLATWSIFANFFTLPLISMMFVAEYGIRRWLFPDIQRAHILDAVRAFRANSAQRRL
jgi:uncharacterized membrane protein